MKTSAIMRVQRTIVSAIQPTGVLHLGNYFGAVQNWCRLQEEPNTKLYIGIADLHAITTGLPDRRVLSENIAQMAACVLACGIDPARTTLFQQSRVAEHTQLAWILAANVTTAQLQRLSQFEDKAAAYQREGNVPVGLLSYPILQAADILIYRASHVPVGADQSQHLEMTRKIARAFNRSVGSDFFPEPEQLFTSNARVRSLRDPFKKMSKSDADGRSRIELDDSDKEIMTKCRRALTDSTTGLEFDPTNRPAVSALLSLHASVLDTTPERLVARLHNCDKVAYKQQLADDIIRLLTPIRQRYVQLLNDRAAIATVLDRGAVEARDVARDCLRQVKVHCGFDI